MTITNMGIFESEDQNDNHTVFPIQDDFDTLLTNVHMYVSNEVVHLITLINIVVLSCILSIFGLFTNTINIMVFIRQGFQDSINISLCALAVSDFLSLLTLLWICITYNPLFTNADISFVALEVEVVTGGIPHVIAINITAWLTAFITFERCICIAFPLKVKNIITPPRTKVIVIVIFILVAVCQIPTFYTSQLGWKFSPERNRTVLGIIYLDIKNVELINGITFYLNSVLGPLGTFTIVSVCTAILSMKLYQKSKWRLTAKAIEDNNSSKRDQRIIKMVVIVAIIFILSFTPTVVIFILMVQEPEFRITGKYHNNFMVALDCSLLVEAINGSVNIFIYYNMSSKYKVVFRHLIFKEKMMQ